MKIRRKRNNNANRLYFRNVIKMSNLERSSLKCFDQVNYHNLCFMNVVHFEEFISRSIYCQIYDKLNVNKHSFTNIKVAEYNIQGDFKKLANTIIDYNSEGSIF